MPNSVEERPERGRQSQIDLLKYSVNAHGYDESSSRDWWYSSHIGHKHVPRELIDVDGVESHQDEEEAERDHGAGETGHMSSGRIEALVLSSAFPVDTI